jgi:hypothetical protein
MSNYKRIFTNTNSSSIYGYKGLLICKKTNKYSHIRKDVNVLALNKRSMKLQEDMARHIDNNIRKNAMK